LSSTILGCYSLRLLNLLQVSDLVLELDGLGVKEIVLILKSMVVVVLSPQSVQFIVSRLVGNLILLQTGISPVVDRLGQALHLMLHVQDVFVVVLQILYSLLQSLDLSLLDEDPLQKLVAGTLVVLVSGLRAPQELIDLVQIIQFRLDRCLHNYL
jgi:hypothetical protein